MLSPIAARKSAMILHPQLVGEPPFRWWHARSPHFPDISSYSLQSLSSSHTGLLFLLPAPGCQQASQAFAPAFSSAWNILPPCIHMKSYYRFPSFINCYLPDAAYTDHSTYAGYFSYNLPPPKIVPDLPSYYSFICFLLLEDKLLE